MAEHLLSIEEGSPDFLANAIEVGDVIQDRIRPGDKDYTVTAVYVLNAENQDLVFGATCDGKEGIFAPLGFYPKK